MTDETDEWSASALSVRETLRDAIDAGSAPDSQARLAVATVAGVEGSAYRRPGAKRLLDPAADSRDDPLAALAERALADGPVCETFDLTGQDESLGLGLGYNGVVDVLVEPADESFRPALERLAEGERVALLTVVGGGHPDAEIGVRAVVCEDGASVPATDARPALPDDLLAEIRERASEFAAAGRSEVLRVETERGTAEISVDGLEPVPELLVFGGDGDVRPVARFASEAGFRVTVAVPQDGRDGPEEVPSAHEVVATRPPELAEVVSRSADTYAVLMSHDFAADRLALTSLLATDVPYVGVMGPRKRFEEMRADLAEAGVQLTGEDAERIATPVGLDLGGGDPTQIALSVVAEALAVSNGRKGGRLVHGEEPIHPRSELE
ncbi:XdhC family protein [Halorussus ruber]|uniref:XdhC family protein n=1 Tax=Halorussus ruber TaxID=1126238 RepID=UPI001091A7AD|nr:XdhC/CoxI family protein [Halorussus ruber]